MNNKSQTSKKQQNFIKGKIKSMKLELDKLLSQPLIPKGVSTKYLTSGVVRDLADRLLDKSSYTTAPNRHGCHEQLRLPQIDTVAANSYAVVNFVFTL
ncbi:1231_t:CDS:2 [Entrophospora sp. SA101]|nr:1231_t:CDS:2 [Entrophospora sp. SA101]